MKAANVDFGMSIVMEGSIAEGYYVIKQSLESHEY